MYPIAVYGEEASHAHQIAFFDGIHYFFARQGFLSSFERRCIATSVTLMFVLCPSIAFLAFWCGTVVFADCLLSPSQLGAVVADFVALKHPVAVGLISYPYLGGFP